MILLLLILCENLHEQISKLAFFTGNVTESKLIPLIKREYRKYTNWIRQTRNIKLILLLKGARKEFEENDLRNETIDIFFDVYRILFLRIKRIEA